MESKSCHQLVIIFSWTLLLMSLLPITHSYHFVSNENRTTQNGTVKECRRRITYEEMKNILQYQPCVFIEDHLASSNNCPRLQRCKGIDNRINALNGLINEHRTMINFLLDTFINTTFYGKILFMIISKLQVHHYEVGEI